MPLTYANVYCIPLSMVTLKLKKKERKEMAWNKTPPINISNLIKIDVTQTTVKLRQKWARCRRCYLGYIIIADLLIKST
jgi:hypothetical protein